MSELVLPRRAKPQPDPALNAGGDCGACVLGGLLGLEVAVVYQTYLRSVGAFMRADMENALVSARAMGRLDRMITDVPIWPKTHLAATFGLFGLPGWMQRHAWFGYVRLALDAGYYGICAIDQAGRAADSPGADHWVLICGARQRAETASVGGVVTTYVHDEILVSCSVTAPGGTWRNVRDFLVRHGGFEVFLARPAEMCGTSWFGTAASRSSSLDPPGST